MLVAFDYLLVAIVLLSALIGVLRGFIRETLSLATWIAAVWLAWVFAPTLEPLLGLDSPLARLWLARVLVFVAVVALGALAGHLIGSLVRRSNLSGADRGLGALFGFARGALLVAVVVVIAQALDAPRAQWWAESKIAPYGLAVAAWVGGLFESDGEAQSSVAVDGLRLASGTGETACAESSA
ncbi:MAG: CvpA family protein [Gammaproteobacteria bacterium]